MAKLSRPSAEGAARDENSLPPPQDNPPVQVRPAPDAWRVTDALRAVAASAIVHTEIPRLW